jgi:hypothetical protein
MTPRETENGDEEEHPNRVGQILANGDAAVDAAVTIEEE